MPGALCPPLNPPLFNSVCLGLSPGHIDSPYLVIMSWITIPMRDEYYATKAMKRSYFSLFWQQGSNKQTHLDLDNWRFLQTKANLWRRPIVALTLRNMEGDQVLLRYYVFVIGIFTTLPSISRGKTLNCVQAVYIFSSLAPLENINVFRYIPKATIFSFCLLNSFQPRFH